MTDQEIIHIVLEGETKSFRLLVERYEPLVASTVIGMLGQCPEALDVGQTVFIRFFKSLSKFRNESGVGTYLAKIAMNLSLNELKKRKRAKQIFHDDPDYYTALPGKERPDKNVETKELVRKTVGMLEPNYRAVVVLRIMKGFSTGETAKILKIPAGTVLSRLSRGQQELRKLMKTLLEDADDHQ